MERYSRHIMLPEIGMEGQKRLLSSSALIVGLGGLGAPVATYLTCAGVGRIGLADNDTVSMSNLQRQTLYDESQIGLPKTEAARQRLSSISSSTEFELFPEGINEENAESIVARFDIVVDCTDNYASRYIIDDACAATGRTWVYGAISEFNGQVSVFNYKKGIRYTDLYPDRDQLLSIPKAIGGVLGAVPGVTGSIQACEALKVLTGIGETLEGRILVMNLLEAYTDIIEF